MSIIYQIVVVEIWITLKGQYQQGNGPHIFQSKKNMMNTLQGNLSMTQYFTKVTSVWEELDDFRPLIQRKCGGAQLLQQFLQIEFVMSFLMGLNESFAQT